MPTKIVSFGYKHGDPAAEEGSLVIDLRPTFTRNPHRELRLRHLKGDHPNVGAYIEQQHEFYQLYEDLLAQVASHLGVVYIGCTGGHHRSVYLALRLSDDCCGTPVEHRDYNIE